MMGPVGLGLFSLLGVGALGYSYFNKRSLNGFSSFGKLSTWRSFLPFRRSSVLSLSTASTTAPLAPAATFAAPVVAPRLSWRRWLPFRSSVVAPIATGGVINSLATGAPIVHNRKVPLKERAISKVTGKTCHYKLPLINYIFVNRINRVIILYFVILTLFWLL
jgi:hypothetical protein